MIGFRAVVKEPNSINLSQNLSVDRGVVEDWAGQLLEKMPEGATAVVYQQLEEPVCIMLRHGDKYYVQNITRYQHESTLPHVMLGKLKAELVEAEIEAEKTKSEPPLNPGVISRMMGLIGLAGTDKTTDKTTDNTTGTDTTRETENRPVRRKPRIGKEPNTR